MVATVPVIMITKYSAPFEAVGSVGSMRPIIGGHRAAVSDPNAAPGIGNTRVQARSKTAGCGLDPIEVDRYPILVLRDSEDAWREFVILKGADSGEIARAADFDECRAATVAGSADGLERYDAR